MMAETLHELGEHIASKLGSAVTGFQVAYGELTVEAEAAEIIRVLTFVRDDAECNFVCFIDICGVDYPDREKRFDVVYHMLSMHRNQRIRVKLVTDENTPVPSALPVWPAANWFEREAFDLFGILFRGHPDLRRLLTDYGFIGHPFRKDFPLIGNVEVRYDPIKQRVVYEPVSIESRTLVPRVIRHDNRYDPALGGN